MSGPHAAFFYGTLMVPEVFYAVVYGTPQPPDAICQLHTFQPAVLDGYCRHAVKRADYPGIIAEEGQSVRGVYATGLTEANVGKLDHFEGTKYTKESVKVRLLSAEAGDDGEKEAMVYVYKDKDRLEPGEWDFEHFCGEKLGLWTNAEFVSTAGETT